LKSRASSDTQHEVRLSGFSRNESDELESDNRISGIGYRVSGVGYRVSGIGYRASGLDRPILAFPLSIIVDNQQSQRFGRTC